MWKGDKLCICTGVYNGLASVVYLEFKQGSGILGDEITQKLKLFLLTGTWSLMFWEAKLCQFLAPRGLWRLLLLKYPTGCRSQYHIPTMFWCFLCS